MTEKYPLPQGWRWVSLAEVLKEPLKNGINYSKENFGKGIKFVNVSDIFCPSSINNAILERINISTQEVIKFQLKTGDILIVRSSLKREGIAYPALFMEDDEPVIFCGFLIRIRPDQAIINPIYLLNYLRSTLARESLIGSSDTVTITNVDQGTLLSLAIPLPPLPEQRRIAAKIQELMQDVDRARAACEKQLEAAQILPAAYLREVFESEEAKNWEIKKLIEVCEKPEYGYTASAESNAVGPKFIRITDIQDGKVDWSKVPYCRYDEEAERFLLKLRDILVARTGATTGKSFLIKEKPPKAIFASYLIRVRVRNYLLPEYLYFFLQTNMYWNQVAINKRGGSQPNMNAKLLSDIVIPVPTIQLQHAIISLLQKKITHTEGALKLIKNQRASIYAFPQAILTKAFRGDL